MRRLLALTPFAIAGLISGAFVGAFNTAFVPRCGDPCAEIRLGSSATWGIAFLVAFPTIGGIALKKLGSSPARTAAVAAFLSLLALLPAATIYGYELHQQYWQSPARLGVPNLDFSEMAIATRPVDATESGGTAKVQVKPWERCALGYATCDDPQPRTVEAVCLGSRKTVVIDEKDWPAFQRIPAEDLQGIEIVSKDMQLCAEYKQ